MDKLQSFLGLEPLIRKEHFVFNEAKGFYCLKNPITSNNNCMGSDKGRKPPTIDESILEKLRRIYKLENVEFFKIWHHGGPFKSHSSSNIGQKQIIRPK